MNNSMFFCRDADKNVIAVCDFNDENIVRLQRLSKDHAFEVMLADNFRHKQIVVRQGLYQGAKYSHLDQTLVELSPLVTTFHGASATSCGGCELAEKEECDGLSSVLTQHEGPDEKEYRTVDHMSKSLPIIDTCQQVTYFDTGVSLSKKDMIKAGFKVSDEIRNFVREPKHQVVDVMFEKNVEPRYEDFKDLQKFYGTRHPDPKANSSKDISILSMQGKFLDKNEYLRELIKDMKSYKADELETFKKDQCSKCVYGSGRCKLSHSMKSEHFWDKREHCYLSLEEVIEWTSAYDIDHVREYLTRYTVCGETAEIINPDTNRKLNAILSKVDIETLSFEVKKLSPPYEHVCDMSMAQAMANFGFQAPELDEGVTEEKMRVAAGFLMEIGKLNEMSFYTQEDGGYPKRNDILYIDIGTRLNRVSIGSDTRASDDGSFGYRGDSISVDKRPRFRTDYTYPFFEDLQSWTRTNYGAGKRWAW